MKMIIFLAAIALMGTSAPSVPANVKVEGVPFASAVETRNTTMTLHGYGLLRYMVFIKAYAGALYTEENTSGADILGPVSKRLELQYFHSISREDFARATRKKILDNIDAAETVRLQARIDRLAELYQAVEPGDRYALTYIPGKGTELALNGNSLGTIPGSDFARAVFAIWLGSNPIDADFRDSLLGMS